MCGSQVEAHEFSDCRSVVGKELVSAAISAAELNVSITFTREERGERVGSSAIASSSIRNNLGPFTL